MKHIFAVKDLAVQAYGLPFFVRSKGEALRSFQDEVNRKDGESAVAKHPEDYELYQLGTYNEETAEIEGNNELKPVLVARAKDLLTVER